jgi:tetraacyldisaccharide 4'-kinase
MFLSPLGWFYGKITDIRNALYERGTLRSYDLGAKTISIGNITTGGTGKTPLVAYVAEILSDAGEKVCILTRGYGRESSGRVLVSDGQQVLVDAAIGGDEPVELATKLVGKAIVVADGDRVSAAAWARDEFGVTAFVLDDAFQHRRAKRDLDIVCIDAMNPFGNERLLPAGSLREPLDNLARANVFALTRTNLVDSLESVIDLIRRYNPEAPIFGAEFSVAEITMMGDFLKGRLTDNDDENRQFVADAFAFCGVGNPDGFRSMLGSGQFAITGLLSFPDHHRYRQSDINTIETAAKLRSSRGLITTAKDAVKLKGLEFGMPCFVVEAELRINDAERFRQLITSS